MKNLYTIPLSDFKIPNEKFFAGIRANLSNIQNSLRVKLLQKFCKIISLVKLNRAAIQHGLRHGSASITPWFSIGYVAVQPTVRGHSVSIARENRKRRMGRRAVGPVTSAPFSSSRPSPRSILSCLDRGVFYELS